MNKHTILALAAGALQLLAGSATAQQAFDRFYYVGIGGGVSQISPDPKDSGYVVDDDSDTGYKVYLGWDFAERWGAELHLAAMGAASLVQGTGQTLTPPSGEIDYQSAGLSALYYVFNSAGDAGRFDRTGLSLFLRGGITLLDTASDTLDIKQVEDAQLSLGLGVEYGMSNHLAVRAEFEAFDEDAQLATLGLLWRFGGSGNTAARSAAGLEQTGQSDDSSTGLSTEASTSALLSSDAPEPLPLDSDKDGIADAADGCPDTTVGVVTDSRGCPLFDGVLEGVNFISGSAELTAEARTVLDRVAADLVRLSAVRLAVMAHTDNSGPAAANLELSKQRALAVARYLVQRGVEPTRLRPEAYGESTPRVSNATPEGRAENRRVELRTIN